MAGQDPTPQTSLLILLGASSWPEDSDLSSSTAFANAVSDLRAYFLSDSNGFHLPESNVLDLFDSNDSGLDILKQISDFLKDRIERTKGSSTHVRDLLVYYVGHGGITNDSSTFYLAIRRTQKDYEKSTSIEIDDLTTRLKKGARFQRRILIFDCCFAGRAVNFLQGSHSTLLNQKIIASLEEKDRGEGFPSRGTSFLASSGKDAVSIILKDETSTMFTSALLSALRTGDLSQKIEQLPLRTVYRLTTDLLIEAYRDDFPRPELHSPDQSEGDVANIPFFPNPHTEEREEAKQSAAVLLPSDPSKFSTPTPEQVAFSSSFPNPTLSGESVEDAIKVPSLSADEWYRRGIKARTHGDVEAAVEAWQHVLTLDAVYLGGKLAKEISDLTPQRIAHWRTQAIKEGQAKNWVKAIEAWSALLRLDSENQEAQDGLRVSLRAEGSAAYERGDWKEAIARWETLLRAAPGEKLIREHLEATRTCQQYQYLYEHVRVFVGENELEEAKTQLETLYKYAPYFGDPQGLAQQIGYPVPPDFLTMYQQREKQQEERIKRQLQRRQQIKDGGLSGMQWGALIGAVVGVIVGSGLDAANFAGKEWWMGVGIATLGGLGIGALGGAISVGIGFLFKKSGWRVRIFGGTLTGALLGAIIGTIDTIFVLNIVFHTDSGLYGTTTEWGALLGGVIGGLCCLLADKVLPASKEAVNREVGETIVGKVAGKAGETKEKEWFGWAIGGCFVGWGIGWVIASTISILSQGWSIALIPHSIAGGGRATLDGGRA